MLKPAGIPSGAGLLASAGVLDRAEAGRDPLGSGALLASAGVLDRAEAGRDPLGSGAPFAPADVLDRADAGRDSPGSVGPRAANSGGGGGSDRERDRRAAAVSRTPCASTSEVSSARTSESGSIASVTPATCLLEERLEIGTLPLDSHASVLDPLVAVSA